MDDRPSGRREAPGDRTRRTGRLVRRPPAIGPASCGNARRLLGRHELGAHRGHHSSCQAMSTASRVRSSLSGHGCEYVSSVSDAEACPSRSAGRLDGSGTKGAASSHRRVRQCPSGAAAANLRPFCGRWGAGCALRLSPSSGVVVGDPAGEGLLDEVDVAASADGAALGRGRRDATEDQPSHQPGGEDADCEWARVRESPVRGPGAAPRRSVRAGCAARGVPVVSALPRRPVELVMQAARWPH
jgi:hypothetical protein